MEDNYTNSISILDTIKTTTGTVVGIVDFTAAKHIIFYDLTQERCPHTIAMILVWRLYFPEIRFSVFLVQYGGKQYIGAPILISRKGIEECSIELVVDKPKRRKVRRYRSTL